MACKATLLTLGFVALNADGNGLRVVGFVAFRHDIGLVCCRLYRVLAFFRTGREPVHSNRRRCAGSERGSVDQAEQPASSMHRSVTALPMSSGVPSRLIGVHPPSCQARVASWMSCGRERKTPPSTTLGGPKTPPGLMPLTVIRRGAKATAK